MIFCLCKKSIPDAILIKSSLYLPLEYIEGGDFRNTLNPEIEQFIQTQIESGKYASAEEVIVDALKMFAAKGHKPVQVKTPEELGWPPGFFEQTAGCLQDDPLVIPFLCEAAPNPFNFFLSSFVTAVATTGEPPQRAASPLRRQSLQRGEPPQRAASPLRFVFLSCT